MQPGDVLTVTHGVPEIRRVAMYPLTYPLWALGQTYTAQSGRGRPSEGRVKVLDLRGPEYVRNITPDEVRAEGFTSRETFLDLWRLLHGDAFYAWVLTIERVVVTPGLKDLRTGEMLVPGDDRFDLILSDFRRRHWPDSVTRDGITFRAAKRGGHPVFTVVRMADSCTR